MASFWDMNAQKKLRLHSKAELFNYIKGYLRLYRCCKMLFAHAFVPSVAPFGIVFGCEE
ncbi:hypothetical protein SDC9_42943 [bioreactor metagenome]|uniref:Uncharacterized protein n=1 Tax=bioreactor metagenome TaxID=1076179 RepID=A0A644VZA0_9ZZZZ